MTPELSRRLLQAVRTSPVYDVAHETPLQRAPRLSARLGGEVWLKREDQQPIFSFKIRGAYHCIASLSPDARARGVIAASAGNHAQGVAYAARHLQLRCVIVMPRTTPAIKVDAVRALGAEIILTGDQYADAETIALQMAASTGLTMIHPYDDERVVEGQATVAAEILRQAPPDLDTIFVPVGGGGLIAGIGVYVKATMPRIRVIGVEPVDSDAMYRALAAGRPVPVDRPGLFADGVAVRQVGRYVFPLVQATVDAVIRVTDDQICAAIRAVFEDTRGIVEPAGALAVAGLEACLQLGVPIRGSMVALLSGANMNFDRLGVVVERTTHGQSARQWPELERLPERESRAVRAS